MKCDKLIAEKLSGECFGCEGGIYEVYDKAEVDEAIAELKERVSEERSAKVDYKISANDLSDGLAEAYAENKQLKRALWLSRAMRAHAEKHWAAYVEYVHVHEKSFYAFDSDDIFCQHNHNNDSFKVWYHRWVSVERKCLKKAEEYK